MDGTWYGDRKLCDSKFAPVEYRFQFGPEPSIDPSASDFRESGDNTSLLYAYSGLSLVGIIVGFFAIKKWRKRR